MDMPFQSLKLSNGNELPQECIYQLHTGVAEPFSLPLKTEAVSQSHYTLFQKENKPLPENLFKQLQLRCFQSGLQIWGVSKGRVFVETPLHIHKHKNFSFSHFFSDIIQNFQLETKEWSKMPRDLNPPNKILFITFYDINIEFSVDDIYKFFCFFGPIHKAVRDKKQKKNGFLVEYFDIKTAEIVKRCCHNLSFEGWFSLSVCFAFGSKKTLNVEPNSEYQRLIDLNETGKKLIDWFFAPKRTVVSFENTVSLSNSPSDYVQIKFPDWHSRNSIYPWRVNEIHKNKKSKLYWSKFPSCVQLNSVIPGPIPTQFFINPEKHNFLFQITGFSPKCQIRHLFHAFSLFGKIQWIAVNRKLKCAIFCAIVPYNFEDACNELSLKEFSGAIIGSPSIIKSFDVSLLTAEWNGKFGAPCPRSDLLDSFIVQNCQEWPLIVEKFQLQKVTSFLSLIFLNDISVFQIVNDILSARETFEIRKYDISRRNVVIQFYDSQIALNIFTAFRDMLFNYFSIIVAFNEEIPFKKGLANYRQEFTQEYPHNLQGSRNNLSNKKSPKGNFSINYHPNH